MGEISDSLNFSDYLCFSHFIRFYPSDTGKSCFSDHLCFTCYPLPLPGPLNKLCISDHLHFSDQLRFMFYPPPPAPSPMWSLSIWHHLFYLSIMPSLTEALLVKDQSSFYLTYIRYSLHSIVNLQSASQLILIKLYGEISGRQTQFLRNSWILKWNVKPRFCCIQNFCFYGTS